MMIFFHSLDLKNQRDFVKDENADEDFKIGDTLA